MQCIFHTGLLLFHFHFGGSTHLDHGNTAGQLGHAFLHFFLIVIGSGFLNLGANLVDPAFDVLAVATTVNDGGVFLGYLQLLGLT